MELVLKETKFFIYINVDYKKSVIYNEHNGIEDDQKGGERNGK